MVQRVRAEVRLFHGSPRTTRLPRITRPWTLRFERNHFPDGEQFNSTAAYFSILRGFIIDGTSPTSLGGYGPAWILQQLANTSLSYVLSGQTQAYTPAWVNQVLAENFVQITGGNTFVMNLQHYDGALPYLFATWGAPVMAPDYTMQHDIATWTNAGYSFPMRLSAETRPP